MIIEHSDGRYYQVVSTEIPHRYVEIPSEELSDYTCIDCPCRNRCEYAFNPMCIDGECLSKD